MRKMITALFLMLLMMTCCFTALADSIFLQTETGANGEVTYPASELEGLNELLQARLGIGDALILLRGGAEITCLSDVYAFEMADGTNAVSICFTQQGKIRFGRYGQVTNALLLNADTGTEIPLESLFASLEEAQSALDLYVEENVQPYLNTYLDAAEMLPVPLEHVSLSPEGMTIHYPADRFSFFSGNSGAVEIKYYEIADILSEQAKAAAAAPLAPAPDSAQQILTAAQEGRLYGVTELRVGEGLQAALLAHGTLAEPDYIADGEIYEVEAPFLRSVSLLAERGAEDDEAALITGIRSRRVNLCGLITGLTTRNTCLETLGEPQSSVLIDASAAESYRVVEGRQDAYAAGDYTLLLYYDVNDTLYAAQVSR